MARVFKASYKSRNGKTKKSRKWYVEFRDHIGLTRRMPAFEDKGASLDLGRMLEKLATCRSSRQPVPADIAAWFRTMPAEMRNRIIRFDLIEKGTAFVSRPLKEYLGEFETHLAAAGNSASHIKETLAIVRKVLKHAKAKHADEITRTAFERYQQKRKSEGVGARTRNGDVKAAKRFTRWLVDQDALQADPLASVKRENEKRDRRRRRRALTDEEVSRLLTAVASGGETHHGLSPRERIAVYRLALEAGLRWSEIRALTHDCLELQADPPLLRLSADMTKNKKDAVLPLRPSLAEYLKAALPLGLPAVRLFPGMWKGKGSNMLREDLEATRRETDGKEIVKAIPYIDEAGRVADFHALRHTFGTNLARAGVHPKAAQTLMRHSSITLTMDLYTHTALETKIEALSKLPDFRTQELQEAKATGTDENVLPECLPFPVQNHARKCNNMHKGPGEEEQPEETQKSPETRGFSSVSGPENVVGGEGLEPPNFLLVSPESVNHNSIINQRLKNSTPCVLPPGLPNFQGIAYAWADLEQPQRQQIFNLSRRRIAMNFTLGL